MSEIQMKDMHKAFGDVRVIEKVDLTIEDGEFAVFVGPSGCGKSTLLRMVAGLETITSGELTISGVYMNDVPPSQRGISMVFQSYALYPHLSIFDNMAFSLQLAKIPKPDIEKQVLEAARILQLDHLLDRLPKELSGGQRQRVAIGRSIVRQPKVFLFDEPLSNLDAALRVQTRMEIANLHSSLDASMIYVTHDQVEAMTLADKIVLLNAGEPVIKYGSLCQVGTPMELYFKPRNKFAASFIGSPKMNFMHGALQSSEPNKAIIRMENGDQVLASVDASRAACGDKVVLGIRPEHTLLGTHDGMSSTTGQVAYVEVLGEASYVYMKTENNSDLTIVRQEGRVSLNKGDNVPFSIDPDQSHLFDAEDQAFHRTVEIGVSFDSSMFQI